MPKISVDHLLKLDLKKQLGLVLILVNNAFEHGEDTTGVS